MNLGFKTKWPNGEPTFFINKIWDGLRVKLRIKSDVYLLFVKEHEKKFNEDFYLIPPSKIHTIREDKPDRWKAGNKIHFIINNRTKNLFQFAPVIPVISVQTIFFNWGLTTKIVSKILKIPEKDLGKPLISKEPNIFIDKGLSQKKKLNNWQ